jgi:O-acetyl-ADP-ribose deacetylase
MIVKKIKVIKGDITKLKVDAIVNAANSSLLGGGGVDGAIHRAAGKQLLDACSQLNGCLAGEAKITPGFNLPSSFVIHTVGPIWHGGKNNEQQLLESCYTQSLKLAIKYSLKTIAFPNISTGAYGFPKLAAARVATGAVAQYPDEYDQLSEVIFCCFDDENYDIYNTLIERLN